MFNRYVSLAAVCLAAPVLAAPIVAAEPAPPNPGVQPVADAAPVPPPDLPDTYQQLVDLPSSDSLDDKLAEAITYLTPLVTTLEAMHAALVSEPATRMAQVSVRPVGGGYAYVDSVTGYTSVVYGSSAQADMALQIYQDTLLGTVEQAVRDRYTGLSIGTDPIVSADDTISLRKILDDWQACRDGYRKLQGGTAG